MLGFEPTVSRNSVKKNHRLILLCARYFLQVGLVQFFLLGPRDRRRRTRKDSRSNESSDPYLCTLMCMFNSFVPNQPWDFQWGVKFGNRPHLFISIHKPPTRPHYDHYQPSPVSPLWFERKCTKARRLISNLYVLVVNSPLMEFPLSVSHWQTPSLTSFSFWTRTFELGDSLLNELLNCVAQNVQGVRLERLYGMKDFCQNDVTFNRTRNKHTESVGNTP